MTTETIERITPVLSPVSAQLPAAEALVALIAAFGHLPGGYLRMHRQFGSSPVELCMQMESVQDFEVWRVALGIAASDVELKSNSSGNAWLKAQGSFHGVVVEVTGHGVAVPVEDDEPKQASETPAQVAA
ncbi:hypothetical protein ACFWP5_32615 [Streptomyces sp. NPDC058469]|uniref:hypothetical protein n=1 Tax=Streptomyces sp. NPDC058469 TaxID=3346514 RepID=UPI00366033D6